jgi:hypothetical protein
MRVMAFVYPQSQPPGSVPDAALVDKMMAFNDELGKAGVLLDGNGLHPADKGARLRFDGKGAPVVTDGPFSESKEVVGGYWLLQVKSMDEAKAWLSRAPFPAGEMVELRPIFEMSDFTAAERAQHDPQKVEAVKASIEKNRQTRG